MNADNSGWWFALALVNAGLAEQKGRSRLAWFLLSLFLGPFATAWIVIAPRPSTVSSIAPEEWPSVVLLLVAIVLFVLGALAGLAAALGGGASLWVACAAGVAGAGLFGYAAWRKRPAASPRPE
jgi:hypothetical protein